MARLPVGFCPHCVDAPPSQIARAVLPHLDDARLRRARYLVWTVAHGVQHALSTADIYAEAEVLHSLNGTGNGPGRTLYSDISIRDVHNLITAVRRFRAACATCKGTGWDTGVIPCAFCSGTGTGVDAAAEAQWKALYGNAPWFVPLNDIDLDDPEVAHIEVAPGEGDDEPPHMLRDVALHMGAAMSVPQGCLRCKGTGWFSPTLPRWLTQRVSPVDVHVAADAPLVLPLVPSRTFCLGDATWSEYHAAGLIGCQTGRGGIGLWRVEPAPPLEVVAGRLLRADGAVLVLKRLPSSVPEWSETWALPGGKVEPGESRRDALVREWLEEVNVHVRVKHTCWRLDVTPVGYPRRVYVTIYDVDCAPTEPQPQLDPASGTELRWVHAGELPPEECLPSTLQGLL